MARNTVILKGDPVLKEGIAEGAITPGHLVERDATDGDIQVHGTAGGNAAAQFAIEHGAIGNGVDDAYSAADQVLFAHCRPVDEVNALVAAGAAAIAIGDYLESAGDGTLQKHTPQAVDEGGAATFTSYLNAIVGRALEAVDNRPTCWRRTLTLTPCASMAPSATTNGKRWTARSLKLRGNAWARSWTCAITASCAISAVWAC